MMKTDDVTGWGRSLVDLVTTLQDLSSLKVGFVSLTEALDLTTPGGRALAGMLAVFAEFERDILRDSGESRDCASPEGRPTSRQANDAKPDKTRFFCHRNSSARIFNQGEGTLKPA